MDIAIGDIHAGILQKGLRNMEQLQLAAEAWRVRRLERRLLPAQNSGDRDLLRSYVGQRDMFSHMTVISNVRLYWKTVTNVITANASGTTGCDHGDG